MEETLGQKLADAGTLIGVGMAVVFSALAILMVAIMIVNRLAPEKARKAEGPTVLEAIVSEEEERGRVAAVAVALALARTAENGGAATHPGTTGPAGWTNEPSRWAVSGRERVMRSRGKAGRQWGRRTD